ncbi:MAG: hypothetical protein AAGN66_28390 [Acidobacteriota bacterium]
MLSAERLQQLLGCQRVDEKINREYDLVHFLVRPSRPELKSIELCVSGDRSFVDVLGFGPWHCHPDDLEDAIETAAQLVSGSLCVVEERDAEDTYKAGGLYAPGELPKFLGPKIKSLRTLFFDQKPIQEPIDVNLYSWSEHIWVRRGDTDSSTQ